MTTTTGPYDSLGRWLDFACVICAFAAESGFATLLSKAGLFVWPDVPVSALLGWPPDYTILLISSLVSWSVVSAYTSIHSHSHYIESSRYSYWRVAQTLLIWTGLIEAATFLLKLQAVSRQFTLSFAAIASGLIILRHYLQTRLSRATVRTERKAMIVGVESERGWLASALALKPEWSNPPEAGDCERLAEFTAKSMSNQVASDVECFVLPTGQDLAMVELCTLQLLKRKRAVHLVPAIIDTSLFAHSLGDLDGVPLITLEPTGLSSFESRLKRSVDAAVALVLLVFLGPLVALIAVVLKLMWGGPVMLSEERLGLGGRPFKMYRFRTTRGETKALLKRSPKLDGISWNADCGALNGDGGYTSLMGRPLVAGTFGKFPQLFHVLRGDMSLVGPAAIVPGELERYGEYGALMLSVKPGVIGHWRVRGGQNPVDYGHRVKCDMNHIGGQPSSVDVGMPGKGTDALGTSEGAN